MDRILRVLIVDDSAYVRKVIRQMLSRSPLIEVVGAARDAEEALTLVRELRPDVVTLDLIMPGMGGIGFIREQMSRAPAPIVVVSIASESSELALEALDSGAIDFVQKPSALATEKVFDMADELIEKVKAAGSVSMGRRRLAAESARIESAQRAKPSSKLDVVVIGVSTGGPQALKFLIPQFPPDFPVPIVMVMHMPVGYTELYAKRLNDLSPLEVLEAEEGAEVRSGRVFLAPAGRHLTFRRMGSTTAVHLDARPFDALHRPSVDILFRSAAETFGAGVLAVVMTGMGQDGCQGAELVRSKGGMVFAEAEESCVVFGMPRAAMEAGLVQCSVPLEKMADAIMEVAYGAHYDRS